MKKTLLLILTICTIGISKAENIITAQYPDKITYDGTEYNFNSNPLEPYFDKNPDKRPGMASTALWRGYVAHFEIIENQLYVTDITRPISQKDSEGNYERKWVSIYRTIFPTSEKVKIDWYTGILILPHGKMVEYVHLGYASTYSKYWLLEVYEGNFNEARKYKNKEFEMFEKTEEYKKLYAEMKENDEYNDDEFIKSFISDFVINYTTKFLTE